METTINRPIWKDTRFWTGLAWLPGVLAAGWLFKALGNETYLLVKAHQALGTEVAISEAVSDEENLGGDQIVELKYETPIRMGSGESRTELELFSAKGLYPADLESGKVLPVHPVSVSLTGRPSRTMPSRS